MEPTHDHYANSVSVITSLYEVVLNFRTETPVGKWPEMTRRALEYRKQNGDPVENLVRLLTDLVDDPVLWKRVVDEPYG